MTRPSSGTRQVAVIRATLIEIATKKRGRPGLPRPRPRRRRSRPFRKRNGGDQPLPFGHHLIANAHQRVDATEEGVRADRKIGRCGPGRPVDRGRSADAHLAGVEAEVPVGDRIGDPRRLSCQVRRRKPASARSCCRRHRPREKVKVSPLLHHRRPAGRAGQAVVALAVAVAADHEGVARERPVLEPGRIGPTTGSCRRGRCSRSNACGLIGPV